MDSAMGFETPRLVLAPAGARLPSPTAAASGAHGVAAAAGYVLAMPADATSAAGLASLGAPAAIGISSPVAGGHIRLASFLGGGATAAGVGISSSVAGGHTGLASFLGGGATAAGFGSLVPLGGAGAGAGGCARVSRGGLLVAAAVAGSPADGGVDDDMTEEKEPAASNEEKGEALYFPCMPYYGASVLEFQATAERGMALIGLLLLGKKEAYSPGDLVSVDWADCCVRRVLLQAKDEGYVLAENVVEAARSLAMVYMSLAARRSVLTPFPKLPIGVPAWLSTVEIGQAYYDILLEDFANAVAAVELIV